MKWVKIGAALLVIVFVGLYLTAPFVDSLSSTLPHTLSSRLREIGFALYGYSQAHGRFPDRLEDLTGGSFYLNDAVDPYSPDRSLFRYKRVSMRRASITSSSPSGWRPRPRSAG